MAHRHPHQQGQQCCVPRNNFLPRSPVGKQYAQPQRSESHNPNVPVGAGVPSFGWEQLPPHMLVGLVGFRHQLLHKVELLHLPSLAQQHYLAPVVVLGLVVHLVVHSGLLVFQHLLRKTHTVYQFRNGQFGHLLQRVEDIHHLQVILGRLLQFPHIGHRLVGQGVVIGMLLCQHVA